MHYNLSKLVNSKKDIELPAIVERLSSEREYRRLLRSIVSDARQVIVSDILPTYALSISDGAMITDGFFTSASDLVASLKEKMRLAAINVSLSASLLIRGEAKSLDSKFAAAVKSKTKIDVAAYARDEDNIELVTRLVERNSALIKSLSDETAEKVQQAIIDAQINGLSKKRLSDNLSDILGKQAKRADLIASDQLEKLSAEMIAFRARQAGLYLYIWVSKGDTRVRSRHQQLNGKLQDTRNPNSGDNGMMPRIPIRCRCRAKWVVGGNNSD